MFTLNTKVLKNALDICVIPENIFKFFQQSGIIEITVEGNLLKLNTVASSLVSEVRIQGYNDDNSSTVSIVSNTLFKDLISTISTNELSLKFNDNSLEVISGKSHFNVPKLFTEEDEVALDKPSVDVSNVPCTKVTKDIWKTIQYNEIPYLSDSNVYQAYRRIWTHPDKGTLAGDPVKSYFIHYPESDISIPCLLLPTVVNLLADISSESYLYVIDEDTYLVDMKTDSLEFISKFNVDHEDSNDIGSYGSDMIFDMINEDKYPEVEVETNLFISAISQASLFSSISNKTITFESNDKGITLTNDNANCFISQDINGYEYSIDFDINDIKTISSRIKSDTFKVSPIIKDDEVFGIRLRYDDFIVLIGGIE